MQNCYLMDIHIVSTLTPEDEQQLASVVANALTELLDQLPIAYALRLEATGGQVVERNNVGDSESEPSTVRERHH